MRDDRFFLASALEEYARSEELGRESLAEELGCVPEMLGRLGLCRRPRSDPHGFREDVDRIASRFGISSERLAEVVRRSDALSALAGARQEAGTLAAARDRDRAPGGPPGEGGVEP